MKYLWTLRIAVLLLLLFLLARPVLIRPDPALSRSWAVLVDTSLSMRIKDPAERLDQAKAVVSKLSKHLAQADYFKFSDKLEEIKKEDVPQLEATGQKSQIGLSLQKMFEAVNVRGAILISDGRQVGPGDPVSAAAVAGKPILCVGVGSRSSFKDVSVRNVQCPPFAFKNIQASISATISALGYKGKNLTVRLMEGDRLLQLQNVPVATEEMETSVNFSWTPTTLGTKYLRVQVTPLSDEVTPSNNQKDVTLDVGRDRFRVLYICGTPGPEYSFLRYQFKSDPAVELVTFVILRQANNILTIPDQELSLIPFPTEDVLINQMSTFDLVVLEDFAPWELGLSPNFLHAIKKKVEDGGSFLVMGSPRIFANGSTYLMPGIEDMLPLHLGGDIQNVQGSFKFLPTILSHPILRLEPDSKKNQELWSSLPPLEGVTVVPSVKSGASVVGSVAVGDKSVPVLTVWNYKRGRVGVLNTRTTWRWSMVPSSKAQGAFVYQQFWKNMVLWLTHADEYKTVRVSVESKSIRLGEATSVRAWVYDEYFKPLPDAEVRMQITGPASFQETLAPAIEAPGVFAAPFQPKQLGEHTVHLWATRKGKKYGEDSHSFRVIESQFEEEDLRPDFMMLKEIAETSGGKFVSAEDFSPALLDEFNQDLAKKSGRKILIWNSPWVLGALVCLLGLEWFLRKRRGLP